MRIQFLLGEDEDDEHVSHDLFCEMEELITVDGKEPQWKETARYVIVRDFVRYYLSSEL